MRKHIVCGASAACLALAIPFSAQADDMPGISMSGSMNHDFGFGSYDGGEMTVDDFHMEIDAEIKFTATGTTDGGLTVTAAMEFDADSGGGVDESHLTIAGGFGSIILGEQDNASNRNGNKGIGGGYGGGGYYDCGETWTPADCGAPPAGGGDALGIQYDTPSIGGFQAGVSFQPETDAQGSTGTANDSNIIAFGANFSGDFAGTSLTIGANHVSLKPSGDGDTMKQWGLGATAAIGGTSLHVRYDTRPDSVPNGIVSFDTPMMNEYSGDQSSYGIGIDHVIGALKFGIGYGSKTEENAVVTGMVTAPHHAADDTNNPMTFKKGDINMELVTGLNERKLHDRKSSMISFGAEYNLGGGVKISAVINSGKLKNVQKPGSGTPVYSCPASSDPMDPNVQLVTPVEMELTNYCTKESIVEAGITRIGSGPFLGPDGDALANQDDVVSVEQHTKSYSVVDMDDVGVGIRIAFSF